MSGRVLGIDIRHHVVNGVVVRTGFKTERIETHFQVPLVGRDEFDTQLADAITHIAERIDIKDTICHVALPGDWFIYRNMNIPIKGQSKIRQILPYELEPLLAQPVELFSFDFLPVALDETSNGNHLIAAGVERTRLSSCLDLFAAAKMDPDMVTAGSFALAGCFPRLTDILERTAMVTLDGGASSIYLLVSGQIGMARTFRLPVGKGSNAAIINSNLHQTLSAFEEQYNTQFGLQTIYLNHDSVDDADDIGPVLKGNFDCPVQSVDLAAAAELSIPSTGASWPSGRMNNALALALVRTKGVKIVNFRRGGYGKRLFFAEQRTPLIQTAVLFGLVLVLGILALLLDGYYARRSLRHLNEQVASVFTTTFPEVRRIVDPLQQMKVKIREEKDRIAQMGVTERPVNVIDILDDISRLIPKKTDVTLTGVTIGPENMMLSGDAGNFEMVNVMRADLEKAEWVETSIISSANQNKTGQRIDFKIKLVFETNIEPQDV